MTANEILREAYLASTEVSIDDGIVSGDVRVIRWAERGSELVIDVQFKHVLQVES